VNAYDVGAAVEISTEVRNRAGTLVAPSTIRLLVRSPSGTVSTYTGAPTLVNDSTGKYHADIEVQAAGFWRYRWETTGDPTAAQERVFFVRKQRVST
jgi:hypothetical protein